MGTDVLVLSCETEYVAPRRAPSPERRLMIAVLQDAIHCVRQSRMTHGPRQRVFEEGKQWFLDGDTRWPYSFECICDMLELDPDAVRKSLGFVPGAPSIRVRARARRAAT
jgi:hypothetical protein